MKITENILLSLIYLYKTLRDMQEKDLGGKKVKFNAADIPTGAITKVIFRRLDKAPLWPMKDMFSQSEQNPPWLLCWFWCVKLIVLPFKLHMGFIFNCRQSISIVVVFNSIFVEYCTTMFEVVFKASESLILSCFYNIKYSWLNKQ